MGVVMLAVVMVVGVVSPFSHIYSEYLLRSLDGPLAADDPELLLYIREQVLNPPSTQPYNLLGKRNIASLMPEKSERFYNESLRILFQNKTDGFFVEAGALDGETMSNTLWLEVERGWSGLLVEADRKDYLALITKHRRSWAANVCLAPYPYPSKEMFNQLPHFSGPMAKNLGFKTRAMHGLSKFSSDRVLSNSWFQEVQCLPLESLLLALEMTQVDLLVLDIEGAEMAVLGHLDLQKFNVQVLCVEWKKGDEVDEVSRKISERGYVEVARTSEDIILVQKGSQYQGRLERKDLT